MKPLVVDACAVLALLIEDESTTQAFHSLSKIEQASRLYVPAHFWSEVANGLLVAERRGRASQAKTSQAFKMACDMPLVVDDEVVETGVAASLALAREWSLTVYDAAYLELALRRTSVLVTIDKALARAARGLGVELLIKS